MTISVHKLVCGNCTLRVEGRCSIQGDRMEDLRLACSQIHSNFKDKGFGLEEVHLDWDKINKALEGYETVEDIFKRRGWKFHETGFRMPELPF